MDEVRQLDTELQGEFQVDNWGELLSESMGLKESVRLLFEEMRKKDNFGAVDDVQEKITCSWGFPKK